MTAPAGRLVLVMSTLVAVTLLLGCGSSRRSLSGPHYVVAQPAAQFDQIEVGGVALSPAAAASLAPLPAARTFRPPVALAPYGLDHPVVTVTYRRGGVVVATVAIGSPNFDGHGYYAARTGDPNVYLVLREAVLPALRAAGVTPAPVADAPG